MSKPKQPPIDKFELITQKLLNLMESGKLPWRSPWNAVPYSNAITGHQYRGINPLLAQVDMLDNNYQLPLFVGFAQASEKGWHIKKGSKSTWLLYGGTFTKVEEDPETGEITEKTRRTMKWLQVFNLDCIDDSDSDLKIKHIIDKIAPTNQAPRLEQAEALINSQQADVSFGGNEAFYNPTEDQIYLPAYPLFTSAEAYYSTFIHELIHRTGHPSRLNRNLKNRFGSQAYAFEELVAELGAAFVCNELAILPSLECHASYLQGWIKGLKDDNHAFMKAVSLARSAANLLLENAGLLVTV